MTDIPKIEEEAPITVTHKARPPKPIDPARLKASLERTQGIKPFPEKSGSLPASLIQEYPTEKEYPTEEARKKAMASLTSPETIPPEIKKELTEETRRFKNKVMATQGEEASETKELPHVPPFAEEGPPEEPPVEPVEPTGPYNPQEHIEAKGGAATLRRIEEAQREMEKPVSKAQVPVSKKEPEEYPIPPSQQHLDRGARYQGQSPVAPRPAPLPEDTLRQSLNSPTEAPRKSILQRLLGPFLGKK
jgi:hypothetical protein